MSKSKKRDVDTGGHMEQDEQEKTEGVGEKQHAKADTHSTSQQQRGENKESNNSLLQVLDFLKNSNLINPDMPMRSLFDQVSSIQTEPSTDWGLIGDSGHWVLVWQNKRS